MVRLFKAYVGRGPTEARSHLMGNLLVCVLEGAISHSERTLLAHGDVDAVVAHRSSVQRAMRTDAVAFVEATLGRRVCSFMSANDPTHDVQVEIFVLDGDGIGPPTEESLSERAARGTAQHREMLDDMRALRAEQVLSREALRRTRESQSGSAD